MATGYSVDLLREALAGTGRSLVVRFLPNRRCVSDLRSGHAGLSLEAAFTADEASEFLTSQSIYDTTEALLYDREPLAKGLDAAAMRGIGAIAFRPPARSIASGRYTVDGRMRLVFYLRRSEPQAGDLMARIDETARRWRQTGRDRDVMGRYIDLAGVPKLSP